MFSNFLKCISITFVRHGTTLFNEQGRVQGTSNIPLSKKGFEDIENIVLVNHDYELYYHSPLIRSRDTLMGILQKYNISIKNAVIEENELITERAYGIFEGLTKNEIQDKYPILHEEWMVNENCSVPQAETVEQVIQRIKHFIQYVLGKDYNTILAVTHSGFLYALYKFITDSPMDLKPNDIDISFPNGCIVQLNVEIKMDKIQLELEINNHKYHKNIYH